MCPACLATISMIAAGVFSTGGATLLAGKIWLRKKQSTGGKEFRSVKEKEKLSCHKAA